jgi:hypothetical protein
VPDDLSESELQKYVEQNSSKIVFGKSTIGAAYTIDDSSFNITNENIIDAEFTSIYDNGNKVTTSCKVDLVTREAFDIMPVKDLASSNDSQYVRSYVTALGKEHLAIQANNQPIVTDVYWFREG